MAIFTKAIAASADDGFESSGTMDVTGNVININGPSMLGFWRITDVAIPPGSTINSATLALNFISGSFDDPNVTIYCEDVDDGAALTATTNDISGRTLTTASTTWNAGGIGTGIKTSPSFASSVQEVIDRGGWANENSLDVIFAGNSGSSFRVSTWDSTNPEAEITIDYTPPASSGATVKAMYYARLRGV